MQDLKPLSPQETLQSVSLNKAVTMAKPKPNLSVVHEQHIKENIQDNAMQRQINSEELKHEIEKVVEELSRYNSQLEHQDKAVRLHINENIGRVVITVINRKTNEVIIEYPYKELQKLAEHIKDMTGVFFDGKA